MKYNELKDYLDRNLSIREISEESKKCCTSVRHWMKKYGLKPNFKSFKDDHCYSSGSVKERNRIKVIGDTKYCPTCKQYKKFDEFYVRRKNNHSGYCRQCITRDTIERGRKFKLKCIEYKGGKCQICSYSKCQAALDFHHRNPDEKEFSVCKYRSCKLNDKIKTELDKCDILRANCHREEHFYNSPSEKWHAEGRKLKLDCIAYRGGKCQSCNYSKCQAALDFHHRNPDEKEFAICKKYGCRKLSEKIKKELDKCDLLCANCHREEHFYKASEKWFAEE